MSITRTLLPSNKAHARGGRLKETYKSLSLVTPTGHNHYNQYYSRLKSISKSWRTYII